MTASCPYMDVPGMVRLYLVRVLHAQGVFMQIFGGVAKSSK